MHHLIQRLAFGRALGDALPFAFTGVRSSQAGQTGQIWSRPALIVLLMLSLASVLLGVFHQKIAGDEFIFLNVIYRTVNDQPLGLLQTTHAHLFGWLPRVEGGGIVQIRLARLIYFGIWLG